MSFIVNPPGSKTYAGVASGSITAGKPVLINASGTLSQVGAGSNPNAAAETTLIQSVNSSAPMAYDTANQKVVAVQYNSITGNTSAFVGTLSNGQITWGSPVTMLAGRAEYLKIVYDTASGKIVIFFNDYTNSFYGTAIVGTVSGTSISFGTKVVFSSANTLIGGAAYDAGQQKIVLYYGPGATFYPNIVVGTVSGTSISFGTPVVLASTTNSNMGEGQNVVYDSTAQKTVLSFLDTGLWYSKVGTVAGTNISFGAAGAMTGWTSGTNGYGYGVYDSVNNKTVFANSDSTPIWIVGTVSGTSISFGTAVNGPTRTFGVSALSFNPAAGTIFNAYRGASPDWGRMLNATVSGTTVTFSSVITFAKVAGVSAQSVYNPNDQSVVMNWGSTSSNPNVGFSGTFTQVITSSNLSATSQFLGFSSANYTNGQNAVITTISGIDTNQSALTPGLAYYVQGNGTLSTNPANPSLYAGIALTASSILVKG